MYKICLLPAEFLTLAQASDQMANHVWIDRAGGMDDNVH